MSLSDPIADMLTRIRNAQGAQREMVEMPSSNMKTEIVRILKREGYVKDFSIEGGTKKVLRIYLKYSESEVPEEPDSESEPDDPNPVPEPVPVFVLVFILLTDH